MLITFTSTDISNISGSYCTPAFKVPNYYCTVAVSSDVSILNIMQSSIDGEEWFDISGTSFTSNTMAIQSYTECQDGLQYRVKSATLPTTVQILL